MKTKRLLTFFSLSVLFASMAYTEPSPKSVPSTDPHPLAAKSASSPPACPPIQILTGPIQPLVCVTALPLFTFDVFISDPPNSGILAGTIWTMDWGDGNVNAPYTSTADNDVPPLAWRQHTYSSVTDCNYIVTNGILNPCGNTRGVQFIAVVHGRDIPADGDGVLRIVNNANGSSIINVCAGTQTIITLRDNSTWNCQNPTIPGPLVAVPNTDPRNIEWLYGIDPVGVITNTITGPVAIATMGNAPQASGRFSPVPYGPTSLSRAITIPATCVAGQYFRVHLKNWNKCNWADPDYVFTYIDINVIAYPPPPTVGPASYCFGSVPATITATGTGGVIRWYSDPGLTTLLFTGAVYTHGKTAVGSTTYYVNETLGGVCTGPATTVVLAINPIPNQPTISRNNADFCFDGISSITLTANPNTPPAVSGYQWYKGGAPVAGETGSTIILSTVAQSGVYTVQTFGVAPSNCPGPLSAGVTVNIYAFATSTNPGNKSVCEGANTSFTIAAGGPASTIQWQRFNGVSWVNITGLSVPNDGCIYGGWAATTLGITGAVTGMNNFQYRVKLTTTIGGCVTFSTGGTLTVNLLPTASAGGVLSAICQGGISAALGGSVGGSATGGTWSTAAGGTFAPLATNLNATWTPPSGYSGTATLFLTTSGGPCGTTTASKTQVVIPSPTANAGTALAAICQGGTSVPLGGTVGGSATGGTWSTAAGGVFTPGATDLNATWTPPSGYNGTATLILTTSGGACGTAAANKTQVVIPSPTANTGAALGTICQGGTSAPLGGSVGGSATGGTWSTAAGGTFTPLATDLNATWTPPAGYSGTATLILTTSGGPCGTTTASKNQVVTPSPSANAGIAMSAICQGGTSAPLGGSVGGSATGGTWSTAAGGTFIPSSTDINATWTPPAGYSGTATLILTTSGGACGTATANKTQVVIPSPTANPGAALAAICQGGTSAPLGGSIGGSATGGIWSTTEGGTFTPAATDLNATWTPPAGYNGLATLTLTTTGGACTSVSAGKTIIVNPSPAPGMTVSDPAVCSGLPATISLANSVAGASYQLRLDSDNSNVGAPVSGTGGAITFTVSPVATTIYNVLATVVITGCQAEVTDKSTVTVNPLAPAPAGLITGLANVCYGQTGVIYSIAPVANATNYVWAVPGDVSFSGQGTVSITIDFTAGAVSPVSISVYPENGCGPGLPASAKVISIYPELTAAINGGTTPLCYNTAPGIFTATGTGGTGTYTYLWYKNGVSSGITSQTFAPGVLTATSAFYCAITSGTCGPVNTPATTITVYANLTAAISGGNSPLCYNTAPGTFTATGSGGPGTFTYLWYKDGLSTGVTTQTYTPGSLTATSAFYCAITGGACGTVNTSVTTITVYGDLTAAISGGTSPLCYNTAPGTFAATGTGGSGTYTYLWYKNGVSAGVTSQTYAPGALTATSTFYCAISSGICGPVNTSVTTITVYGDLTAAISGGISPVCYNTSPGTFTATGSGGTGTYTYLWYKNGISTGITTQTYSPGALTVNSTFYCAITSGTCGTVNTPATPITIYGDLTASISGGSTPLCYNTAPGTFIASGGGGTGTYTYLWYKDGVSTGVITQTYTPGALTATSVFYCAITSGACGTVNSFTTITIVVYANLTAGISGGTSPLCYNTDPGSFTATGTGGSGTYTYLWYKNGSSTGVTTQTYSPGALTATSTFYCAISSSICGPVNTPVTTITVYGPLTAAISGGTTPLCYNTAPGTLTATGSGGTGAYTYSWYKDGLLTGATTQTYSPGALTATSTFYCAVTSGTCGTVNTAITTITVYGNLTAVISGGTSPLCYNTAPGTFTAAASGSTGIYTYLWYKNGLSTGVTTQTYSPGALTSTSTFYCEITSGSCGTVNSSVTTITVYPDLTAAIIGGTSPACYNTDPGSFTATGNGGNGTYTWLWYKDGSSTGVTTQTYSPGALTVTSTFYCAITSGICGPVNTPTTTIIVFSLPVVTFTAIPAVCVDAAPFNLTQGSPAGGTYSGTGITASPQFNPATAGAGIHSLTYTYTDGNGCTNSATTNITVVPLPNTPPPGGGLTTMCMGTNGQFYSVPLNSGNTYSWSVLPVNTIVLGGNTDDNFIVMDFPNPGVYTLSVQESTSTPQVCSGPVRSLTLTVNPKPSITGLITTVCSAVGFTVTPVDGLNGVVPSGTTYSWSAPSGTGFTGGVPGSGTSISGTLINTTNTSQTAIYTVTPTSGSCTGTDFTVIVTVNPRPAITSIASMICSAVDFTVIPVNITNGVVPPGTTYSWAAPAVSGGLTGGSAGINDININGKLTNPTNSAQTAIFTVTPTSGSCPGTDFTILLTVNPVPAITDMTAEICSGGTFTLIPANVTNGRVPAGITYSWLAPAITGGLTGGVAGSGASVGGTLNNTTNIVQTATYIVTPTSGSCAGASFIVTVTVDPEPSITAMTTAICSGGLFTLTPANVTNGVVPSGTIYSWPAPAITGGLTGGIGGSNALNITGTLTNPSGSPQTATYIVTPESGNCSGTTFTVTVTVNPLPVPTITGPAASCVNSTGNIYTTEPGMSNYIWNVSSGGIITGGGTGNETVTVTWTSQGARTLSVIYTNGNGCTPTSATVYNVTVNPLPVAILAGGETICPGLSSNLVVTLPLGTPPFELNIENLGTVTGYVSGTDIVVTPLITTTYKLLSVKDANGCVVTSPSANLSGTATVIINILPSITSFTPSPAVCEFAYATFKVTADGTNPTYQWYINDGSGFNPVTDGGTYFGATSSILQILNSVRTMNGYIYHVVVSGCGTNVTSPDAVLTVNIAPELTLHPSDSTICQGSNATMNADATGSSVTWQWYVNKAAGFVVVNDDANFSGSTTKILTITNAPATFNNWIFRARATGICGVPVFTNFGKLSVINTATVTLHPVSGAICENSNITFLGNGSAYIALQWQVFSGGTWTNITDDSIYHGSGTPQLSIINAPLTLNGNQYRLGLMGACTTPYTNAATLTVNANPVVDFTAINPVLACGGVPVVINGNPSGGSGIYTQHRWTGDVNLLNSTSVQAPAFMSRTAGDYNLNYKVTDNKGCTANDDLVIKVDSPSAYFTMDVDNACTPLTVTFTKDMTGIAKFWWDFNDGSPIDSVTASPVHLFTNTSTSFINYYNVKLIVRSPGGCFDIFNSIVTVYPPIDATFTPGKDSVCSGNAIIFTSLSGATKYFWDFGNGESFYSTNVTSHLFTNLTTDPVVHQVKLTTTSFYNCTDIKTYNITVIPMPLPQFTADPLNQIFNPAGNPVTFTNTTNPGTWTWLWRFDDGATSAVQSPVHTYTGLGVFDVTLIVSNTSCSDSIKHAVSVIPPAPIADFDSIPSGCAPLSVTTNNTSLNTAVPGTTYEWDFGDGTISSAKNPVYIYFDPGIYRLKLTVTGPGGTSGKSQIVSVYTSPKAFFEVSPSVIFVNDEKVRCFNLSEGADNYLWEFGDGDTSKVVEPFHKYLVSGVFDITLWAYSDNGCFDKYILSPAVTVKPPGVVRFATVFTPNKDGPIERTDLPTGGIEIDQFFFPPVREKVTNYKLQIFNRLGVLIFEKHDINIPWNGYYKGKLCPQGVYIWYVEGKYENGQPFKMVGDVTLLH